MADFKMGVKIGEIELKLEGEYEDVVKVFADVKESGIGKLNLYGENVPQNRNIISQPQIETNQPLQIEMPTVENEESDKLFQGNDYPTLEEIKIKDLPNGELEWIIVYSAFSSNFGQQEFTKKDIVQRYKENGRYYGGNVSNFSTNIKKAITQNFIKLINKDVYIITPAGLSSFNQIINNENGDRKQRKRTKTKSNISYANYKYLELDLSQEQKNSIRELFDTLKEKIKSGVNKVLLICYWCNKNTEIKALDIDTVYTILKICGETKLFDIGQTFLNMKNRNQYLIEEEKGKFRINSLGESIVEGKILK